MQFHKPYYGISHTSINKSVPNVHHYNYAMLRSSNNIPGNVFEHVVGNTFTDTCHSLSKIIKWLWWRFIHYILQVITKKGIEWEYRVIHASCCCSIAVTFPIHHDHTPHLSECFTCWHLHFSDIINVPWPLCSNALPSLMQSKLQLLIPWSVMNRFWILFFYYDHCALLHILPIETTYLFSKL